MGGMSRPTAGRSGRVEISCTGCGYGGVVAQLPDRCPICGACRWQRIGSTLLGSDAYAHPGSALTTRPRAVGHLYRPFT